MESKRVIKEFEKGFIMGKEEGRNEVLELFIKFNLAQKNTDEYVLTQLTGIFELSKNEARTLLKEYKSKTEPSLNNS